MNDQWQNRLRPVIRGLAIFAIVPCGTPVMANGDTQMSRIGHDGTLHIRDLAIPPSEFWSLQFNRFFAEYATHNSAAPSEVPARNAPKTEWDRFDARQDDYLRAGPLVQVLERYPVNIEAAKVGGVHVGIISPKEGISPKNQHRVLISLRSGGFVYGRGLTSGLVQSAPVASIGQIKVITIDYRQAPFHEYPAATEDVEAVYKKLLKEFRPEAIGIFGCSAGGALAAQATAWFHAKGLPRPGAIGIFCSAPSPIWTRRRGDSGIWLSGNGIPSTRMSNEDALTFERVGWYMEHAASNDPKAFPESSNEVLAKFPPTLFLTGTRAFEMSAVVAAHARFLRLGVNSSLYVMEGGPHAAHVSAIGTPEAHDANGYIARWFDQHLKH